MARYGGFVPLKQLRHPVKREPDRFILHVHVDLRSEVISLSFNIQISTSIINRTYAVDVNIYKLNVRKIFRKIAQIARNNLDIFKKPP